MAAVFFIGLGIYLLVVRETTWGFVCLGLGLFIGVIGLWSDSRERR